MRIARLVVGDSLARGELRFLGSGRCILFSDKEWPGRFFFEGLPAGGYLPGNCAALVSVYPHKKYVKHEIHSEDAKYQKYIQQHSSLARTDGSPASARYRIEKRRLKSPEEFIRNSLEAGWRHARGP